MTAAPYECAGGATAAPEPRAVAAEAYRVEEVAWEAWRDALGTSDVERSLALQAAWSDAAARAFALHLAAYPVRSP